MDDSNPDQIITPGQGSDAPVVARQPDTGPPRLLVRVDYTDMDNITFEVVRGAELLEAVRHLPPLDPLDYEVEIEDTWRTTLDGEPIYRIRVLPRRR
jgi:hypothetical protein